LETGVSYQLSVAACSALGCGKISPSSYPALKACELPDEPKVATAKVLSGLDVCAVQIQFVVPDSSGGCDLTKVRVSFNSRQGASYPTDINKANWKAADKTNTTKDVTLTNPNLEPGQRYTFYVVIYNAANLRSTSSQQTGQVTLPTSCTAPAPGPGPGPTPGPSPGTPTPKPAPTPTNPTPGPSGKKGSALPAVIGVFGSLCFIALVLLLYKKQRDEKEEPLLSEKERLHRAELHSRAEEAESRAKKAQQAALKVEQTLAQSVHRRQQNKPATAGAGRHARNNSGQGAAVVRKKDDKLTKLAADQKAAKQKEKAEQITAKMTSTDFEMLGGGNNQGGKSLAELKMELKGGAPAAGHKRGNSTNGGASMSSAAGSEYEDDDMAGNLKKQSAGSPDKWQSRYFVKSGCHLSYYKTDERASLKGKLNLHQMSSVQVEGNALLLQMHNGVLELRAADAAEASEWADALRMPLPPDEESAPSEGLGAVDAPADQEALWGDLSGQPLNTAAWRLGPKVLGDK
jgi:hypothetical protein